MPLTVDELKAQLSDIEPSERTFAALSPDDVPLLRQLLGDEEGWLAARAVYALSRMDAPEAQAAVIDAARSRRTEVRVAVASAAPLLVPELANRALRVLLDDQDVGVRKFAIEGVSQSTEPALKTKLETMIGSDVNPTLRQLAREKLNQLR